MPDKKSEIKQDMMALAELVYEISKKYGGIYINVACCEGFEHSWTTWKDNNKKLQSLTYWGNEQRDKACNS